MKFPITRESLQAFDQKKEAAEQKEEFIQGILESDITEICNEVKNGMSKYSCEKRIIWKGLTENIRGQGNYPAGNGCWSSSIHIDEYLPRLIDKLKETFLGCDIITDPLKTYIIISWA